MTELVSKEEVLQVIKDEIEARIDRKSNSYDWFIEEEFWDFFEDLEDIIKKSIKFDNQWISVKDRLPESDKVLLYVSSPDGEYDIVVGDYEMDACTGNRVALSPFLPDGIVISDKGSPLLRGRKVTHWQPLPEPPKED